ncbi:DNA protecting protein DprA [Endozoicomonas sp. (ex Bugula neritina AB1)]|nr:DNA protecting protein DprA [Endozoicomonas sp. (ex Bugula neritina AB1)]
MQTIKKTEWQQLYHWLLLSLMPGLGPIKTQRLLECFGTPERVVLAPQQELRRVLSGKVADTIGSRTTQQKINRQLQLTKQWLDSSEAHHIITPDSHLYPELLKALPDAPVILYVIGNPSLLSEPQIAVVGSRRPTPSGCRVAKEFSEQLAHSGLVITSGMAMGIDGAAHQGALSSYGGTIAVLGTGVDQIYPVRHKNIYSLIASNGALVSEFPLGTTPFAGNFPKRNRIISGLSLGVLVVEAALESGSLISARMAAEQGREVFAVPGSVINPLSKGCHKLIRDGAVLVESADDILMELAPQLQQQIKVSVPFSAIQSKEIDPLRLKVIESMGYDVISIDLLSEICGIPCHELSALLTEMELDGVIEATPGGFIRLG